jgi:hypothetical protein
MKDITDIQYNVFRLNTFLTRTLLFLTIIGVSFTEPAYLVQIEYYLKIYIGLFLIYRFNSYRQKIEFNELDRKLAHSSGIILLTTIFMEEIAVYTEKLKKKVALMYETYTKLKTNNIL